MNQSQVRRWSLGDIFHFFFLEAVYAVWTGAATATECDGVTWPAYQKLAAQAGYEESMLSDPVFGITDKNYGTNCFLVDHFKGYCNRMIANMQTTKKAMCHKIGGCFHGWKKFIARQIQEDPIYGPAFETFIELMEEEGQADLVNELKEAHDNYFTKMNDAFDHYLEVWLPIYNAAAVIDPRNPLVLSNATFAAIKHLFTLFGGDYAALKAQAIRHEDELEAQDAQGFETDGGILLFYQEKVTRDPGNWEPKLHGGPADGFNQLSCFALIIITIQWGNVLCEPTNSYDKLNRGEKGGRRSRTTDTNAANRLHCRDGRRNWKPGMTFLNLDFNPG